MLVFRFWLKVFAGYDIKGMFRDIVLVLWFLLMVLDVY